MVKSLFKKATLMALLVFIAFSIIQCKAPPENLQPDVHWTEHDFFNGVLVSTSPNIQINFTRIFGKQYGDSEEDEEALAKHRRGTIVTPDGEIINVFYREPGDNDGSVWIIETSKSNYRRRHLLGTFRSWPPENLSIELVVSLDTMLNWQYETILFNFVPNAVNP